MIGKNSTASVIGENLTLLRYEAVSADQRRFVWLRDLARGIMRDGNFLFGDNRAEDFAALFEDMPTPDGDMLSAYDASGARICNFFDKLTVCRFIAAEYDAKGADLLAKLIPAREYETSPRIAYFRNAFADAAFRIFREELGEPSVSYCTDFTAACEEVYYGRADMCMLPLDSSRDAKLISFYRLIDKYELSPVMSCDVTTPDGSVTTRYALFCRAVSLPARQKRTRDGGCFLEFRLVPDDGEVLCDALLAARECGLSLYKVDSIPLSYSDSEFSCDVILKVNDAACLDALILFLTLAMPEYELLGIYPHIEGKG